ncbi:MAG TPA: FixH family protein [Armatimonadota bacterium]|nr:FixH family protein [Armatimonadota bacterium]
MLRRTEDGGRRTKERLSAPRLAAGPPAPNNGGVLARAPCLPTRWIGFIGAALSALFLTGCPNVVRPGQQVTGPRTPTAPAANTAPVSLEVSPSPPHAYTPSTFTVSSRSPLGAGAVVTITLIMPAMKMPPTRITTHPVGNGEYQGKGSFVMAGKWQAEIGVTTTGKREVRRVMITVG